MFSLVLTLRVIAIAMLLIMAIGYINAGDLQIKQFIAANILFILSLFGAANIKRIAIISIFLAIIIPLGVVKSYLDGAAAIEYVFIYVVMFVYLILVALRIVWPKASSTSD